MTEHDNILARCHSFIDAPLLVLTTHAMSAHGLPRLNKTELHITHQVIITFIDVLHDEGWIRSYIRS